MAETLSTLRDAGGEVQFCEEGNYFSLACD